MKLKILLPILTATLLTSLYAAPSGKALNDAKCQHNNKQCPQKKSTPKNSPFLISAGLPHMTMLIKQNWDNADFALSPEQKEKLLVVRKTTITGIKSLKPQIMPLQKKIKQMTMQGADTSKINPLIDELAGLKADITKVQVKCIHDSKNILTKKQVEFLLQG